MSPDPDSVDARGRRAVAITRGFLPIYAVATASLLVPATLRLGGASVPAASLASTATVVVMAVAAPAYLYTMARLGQYRPQGGLAFRLIPALLHGAYVPLSGPAPTPRRSGLGALETDARRIAADLDAAGATEVARTVELALAEAEFTHLALAGRSDPRAERALGRLRDTIARHAHAPRVDVDALRTALEADRAELRAARDPAT